MKVESVDGSVAALVCVCCTAGHRRRVVWSSCQMAPARVAELAPSSLPKAAQCKSSVKSDKVAESAAESAGRTSLSALSGLTVASAGRAPRRCCRSFLGNRCAAAANQLNVAARCAAAAVQFNKAARCAAAAVTFQPAARCAAAAVHFNQQRAAPPLPCHLRGRLPGWADHFLGAARLTGAFFFLGCGS